jgi:curved DNA-binding protein
VTYKDYYKILGVASTATPEAIKKAYRTLAFKHHPDKAKGDASAEEKFKEINEANEVLSDPEKRKKYDRFGADWKQFEATGAQGDKFDWSRYAAAQGGQSTHMGREEFDTMFAGDGVGDLFELLFGQHGASRKGRRAGGIKGEDLETETIISLEEAYDGSTRLIQLHGQTIRVAIKPGIADQQVLRIAGKGGSGRNGGANGDLYLTISIAHHPHFLRSGDDLHGSLPVGLYTSVLGGKTRGKTMKGEVDVDILKGTSNGTVLRLRGLGMPVYGKKGQRGNLLMKVEVRMPENLSEKELDLFRQLETLQRSR